jgi:negative regulator of flagellin synthesis FlgM
MANDISGIGSNRTQQSGNRTAQRVDDGKTSSNISSNTTSGSDKVSLTKTAARLKDIEKTLSEQSPVDNSRVDDMKLALANGNYKVDADKIADKMMTFEAALDK